MQVSYSAVLYYGYIGVIGVAVWAVLKYFKSGVSLAQIWCTYGECVSVDISRSTDFDGGCRAILSVGCSFTANAQPCAPLGDR